ncbi:DUF3896 family protein [Bacillus sp. 2205SS5-2]|uniref:DUF3896 family protein n=1 Tax=Bacillus sp. 2205SS5-2 TaxID=3109031 RepID=UPI0030064D03
MEYEVTKEKLEVLKQEVLNKMKVPSLPSEEIANLQRSLMNYEYILELTDMNHFERGVKIS